MAKQPHLHRRGNTYYFRQRIPEDLRAHYAGRRELKFSLKTADYTEARRRALSWSAHYAEAFAARREARARTAGPEPALTFSHLDEATTERLSKLWMQSCLDGDERFYLDEAPELDDAAFAARETEQRAVLEETRRALARGRTEPIRPVVDTFLRLAGMAVDVDEASRRRLERAFLKATAQLTAVRLQRMQGEVVETADVVDPAEVLDVTPAGAGAAPGAAGGPSFDELLELWRTHRSDRSANAVADMRVAVRYLREYLGAARTPASVTYEDMEGFCAHLTERRGLQWKTADKRLGQIHALYRRAVRRRRLATNPAAGVEVAKPTNVERGRVAYALDDLRAILATPVFTAGARPRGGKGEAAVWVPLIALYTGARIEEITQLRVADVAREDGIDCLNITDEGPAQSLKNAGSRRRVPLHPELLRAGLLRYAARVRAAGHDRLFPQLRHDCKGRWSGHFGKWYNGYQRRAAGITDRRKSFHSFRHAFKTAARRAGLTEEVHDALTGHVNGAVGRAYGEFPLEALHAALARLNYPGLEVPVIEPERGAPAYSAA